LLPERERAEPATLKGNAGRSFVGSYVLGTGFFVSRQEYESLVSRSPRNRERLLPFIGGEEVNTSPTQDFDRYVINFGQMSLGEAEEWPDLMRVLRERVKPDRDRNARDNYRLNWWLFGEYRPGLFAAVESMDRCLVTSIVSKYRLFSFQPRGRVFSHKLYVFPNDTYAFFASLQSRVHDVWVRRMPSNHEQRSSHYSGTELGLSRSHCCAAHGELWNAEYGILAFSIGRGHVG
jgi:hypothetical protein